MPFYAEKHNKFAQKNLLAQFFSTKAVSEQRGFRNSVNN